MVDKPPIQVTSWDYHRLSAVVDAFRLRGCESLVDSLAEELERAELVEPAMIPCDVVTMHSCVEFVDHGNGEVRSVTLVYPGEEDSRRGKISIVTPVGSALLGLRVEATMPWRTLDSRMRRLTVLGVRQQPEAHGFDGASGESNQESAPPRSLERSSRRREYSSTSTSSDGAD
jgi:regulator of nucleoside diphosphate kinase